MKALFNFRQSVTITTTTGKQTITVHHRYEGAAPMDNGRRASAYHAQNGSQKLTVRQSRAIRKAERRALVTA